MIFLSQPLPLSEAENGNDKGNEKENDILKSDLFWKKALIDNQVESPKELAEFLLLKTSRTFALNIQILPTRLRRQVLLSYLFCRMADTLEDDANLAKTDKINLLKDFKDIFPLKTNWENRLAHFLASIPNNWKTSELWDQLLVAHSHWIFPLLTECPRPVIDSISHCIGEMCDGMIEFTASENPALINTMKDLDRYCYFVAGTVGNLLCELFAHHSNLISPKRSRALKALAVSFGLGLQLTNILKDILDDRKRNISFIPQSLLKEENISEPEFLGNEHHKNSARIMGKLVLKAQKHLDDALEYTCLLPRLEPRLRIFCLWPLFMAAETIMLLTENLEENSLSSQTKITRAKVQEIIRKTSLSCWSNHLIRNLYKNTIQGLDAHLQNLAGAPL